MGCCPLTPCQVDDLLYEVTEVSTASHFSQKKVNTWPFLHIYMGYIYLWDVVLSHLARLMICCMK